MELARLFPKYVLIIDTALGLAFLSGMNDIKSPKLGVNEATVIDNTSWMFIGSPGFMCFAIMSCIDCPNSCARSCGFIFLLGA